MKQQSKFEEIVLGVFRFIIKNALDLATLIIAGIIFIFSNLTQLPYEELLKNIIGLLCLMAVSNLYFRQIRLNKLEKLSEQMNASLHGIVNDVLLSYKIDLIYQDVLKAKTVWMIGCTLKTSVFYMFDGLIGAINNGLNLKMIMMDFRCEEAIKTLCNMYPGSKNIATSQQSLVSCIHRINRIANTISRNPEGSLEVGLFPSLLRYGMIIIDPQMASGKIYLKLYRHTQSSFRPVVLIEKEKHPEWFELFYNQAKGIFDICDERGEVFRENELDRLGEIIRNEAG
jgi:hypothetical protein